LTDPSKKKTKKNLQMFGFARTSLYCQGVRDKVAVKDYPEKGSSKKKVWKQSNKHRQQPKEN
jgi:hypothetical protein